jgi:hypothetical protein
VGGQDAEAAVEGWVMSGLSQNEAEWIRERFASLLGSREVVDLVRGILTLENGTEKDVVLETLWHNGKPLTLLNDQLQKLMAGHFTDLEKRLAKCQEIAADLLRQLLHLATCAELPETALKQLEQQVKERNVLYSGSSVEEICLRELQVVFAREHREYLAMPVSGNDHGPLGLRTGRILARGLHPTKESREADPAVTNVSGMEECAIPRLMDDFGRAPGLETLVSLLVVDVCLAPNAMRLSHLDKLTLVGTRLQNYSKANPPRRVVVIFDCHSGTLGKSPILQDLFTQCCKDNTLKDHMGVTLFIVGLDASQLNEYANLLTNYNFVSSVLCQTATR